MAFFDDLGKKISQAGQSAVQKTKDMTAIAKLNGQISDEEKKVNNAYLQIGKLYVEKHAADCDPEFASLVAAVQTAQSNMAGYQQQIQDIKGVTRCEKCGAEVATGAGFCSTCGNSMPVKKTEAPANPNLIPCIGCGAQVDKTMRFCTACGKPIADSLAAMTPAPAQVPAAPAEAPVAAPVENPVQVPVAAPAFVPGEQPTPPAENVCKGCGAMVPEGYAFCTGCLTPVKAAPAPAEGTPAFAPIEETPVPAAVQPAPVETPAAPGVRICIQCGAQVPEGYAFCTTCGTPVGAVPVPTPVETPAPIPAPNAQPLPSPDAGSVCKGCGAQVPEGYGFCTQCGTPVAKEQPTPVPAPPAGNVCPGCGNPVPDGFAFCTQCGTKVN